MIPRWWMAIAMALGLWIVLGGQVLAAGHGGDDHDRVSPATAVGWHVLGPVQFVVEHCSSQFSAL